MEQRYDSVFISYRRETSRHLARLVFNDLRIHQFDPFLDVESIGSGEFGPIILREISARAHFVFLVSQGSLQRCQNPGDWLRREFEEAVRLRRNLVPLYDGKIPLDSLQPFLVGSMKKLPEYNGIFVDFDYFDAGMGRLRSWLEKPIVVIIEDRDTAQEAAVEQKIHSAIESGTPTEQEIMAEQTYNAAWMAQEYEEKIRLFSKAIDADPSYAAAYFERGNVYLNHGYVREALQDYDSANENAPKDPDILMARGRTHKSLGNTSQAQKDFETAEELYSKAINVDPTDLHNYLARASARIQGGDMDAAIKDYSHVIDLPASQRKPLWEGESGEEYKDFPVAIALWRRALLHFREGNHDSAIQDCTQIIKLTRKQSDYSDVSASIAHSLRGMAHGALGNRLRAVLDLRKGAVTGQLDKEADAGFGPLFSAYLLTWPIIGKSLVSDDPLTELASTFHQMADDL